MGMRTTQHCGVNGKHRNPFINVDDLAGRLFGVFNHQYIILAGRTGLPGNSQLFRLGKAWQLPGKRREIDELMRSDGRTLLGGEMMIQRYPLFEQF